MSEWELESLQNHIKIKHGYAFAGAHITNEPCKHILVTPGNFHIGGGFKTDKFKFYKGEIPIDYVLKENDLVVTMTDLSQETDSLGYSALIPKSDKYIYLHNQRIGLVENFSSALDTRFCYWLLRTKDYHDFIVNTASGTSIMHTSPGRICEFEFMLPPLPEQQAIAEVLSSLDDKIDLLHLNNKTLEEMAGALFKSMIREGSIEGNTSVLLHQIADINPETINAKFRKECSEIEYLDTGSVTKGQITGYQIISIDKAPSRAQRVVRKDDIIYSLVRPIQRHYALIDKVKKNTIASTGFAVIRPKVSCHFIYHLLTSDESVEFFDMIAEASTSTYPSLKPSDIANFEIALPAVKALEQFHNVAELLQEKINKNYIQINELVGLRNIILPKLMSGQLRVEI